MIQIVYNTIPIPSCASAALAQSPPPPEEDAEDDRLLREFGAQLRFAREQVGLSQDAVAGRVGTGWVQSNISAIEAGQVNVSLRTMVRLAEAVGGALSLHLLPPSSVSAGARPEYFIHEAIRILARAVDLLRSPAVRAAERQEGRRRRGRPPKE